MLFRVRSSGSFARCRLPSKKRRACISLGIRFQMSGIDFSSVIIRALRSFRQPSNIGPAGVRRRINLKNRAECDEMAEKLRQVRVLRYWLLFLVDKRVFQCPKPAFEPRPNDLITLSPAGDSRFPRSVRFPPRLTRSIKWTTRKRRRLKRLSCWWRRS
jgi:hypothetical protein